MIDLVKNSRESLVALCEQYEVKNLELFGSATTPEGFDPRTSDIDFLVEFLPLEPKRHAKCYLGLLDELQDMFGRNVDLVEFKAINNPYLLESINKSRSRIYAA
jgi:predicted nucleotidyltransferase